MVDSRTRIAGAFLVGGALVVLAFIAGRQPDAAASGALVSVAIDRERVAIEDTDNDGVPNWQEQLQMSEPLRLPTASSTYEAPKTITGKFALRFFEDLIRSKNYGAFGESQEELIARSIKELEERSSDELFTREDVIVTDKTSEEILRAYGNHIASIALSQTAGSESEAIILQDVLRYENKERLQDLEPIAEGYVHMIKLMLETPVPEAYVEEHLNLLNALSAIREDIRGMQKLYEDPLYTFVRMKRYEDDVLGLSNALLGLFNMLHYTDKVTWGENEPASKLVQFPE